MSHFIKWLLIVFAWRCSYLSLAIRINPKRWVDEALLWKLMIYTYKKGHLHSVCSLLISLKQDSVLLIAAQHPPPGDNVCRASITRCSSSHYVSSRRHVCVCVCAEDMWSFESDRRWLRWQIEAALLCLKRELMQVVGAEILCRWKTHAGHLQSFASAEGHMPTDECAFHRAFCHAH